MSGATVLRRVVALATAVLALSAVALEPIIWGGGSVDARAATCTGADERAGATGTWTVVSPPNFPAGGEEVRAHVVDQQDPRRWYVSNGAAIMASGDGGCSWRASFVLGDTPTSRHPVTRATGRIAHLAASGGRVVASIVGLGARDRAAVMVDDRASEQLTFVVRSTDAGASWSAGGGLRPPLGAPGPVVIAASDPEVVYVATGQTVHASSDGGASFAAGMRLPGAAGESDITRAVGTLAVDPLIPTTVWATSGDDTWRSTDGGGSWVRHAQPSGRISGPAIAHPPDGRPATVSFVQTNADRRPVAVFVSNDGGNPGTFVRRGLSPTDVVGALVSIAAGSVRGDLVLTTEDRSGRRRHGVFRLALRSGRIGNVDEFGLSPLRGVQADGRPQPRYYFAAPRLLAVFDGAPGGQYVATPAASDEQPTSSAAYTEPAPPADDGERDAGASLIPATGTVSVPPGGATTVSYRLLLGARPTRLDVFFVLDTSGSTEPYINGLKRGLNDLARGLRDAGLDARFGVAEYQDRQGLRYRRRADIRPADTQLARAIDEISTNGGLEPGYTAIDQALTGSGVQPDTGEPVSPGGNAHWRRGAVRTLVLIADEHFAGDSAGPDSAGAATIVAASDAFFIGVAVDDATDRPVTLTGDPVCPPLDDDPDQLTGLTAADDLLLRCQLRSLATAARTLAPPGGTDCDGDGTVDVPASRPLVCTLSAGGSGIVALAGPLQRLLLSVRLLRPVVLAARGESPVGVQVAAAGDYRELDLHRDHDLAFRVTFACSTAQAGQVLTVPLEARVGDLPIAEANPRISCGEARAPAATPPGAAARGEKQRPPARKSEQSVVPPEPADGPPPAAVAAPAPPPPPVQVTAQAPAPAQAVSPAQAASSASSSASAPAAAAGSAPVTQPAQLAAMADEDGGVPAVATVLADDEQPLELAFARASAHGGSERAATVLRTTGAAGVLAIALAAARRRRRVTTHRSVRS